MKARLSESGPEKILQPFILRNRPILKLEVEYDANTGEYLIYEKVDDFDYRLPRSLSREEYLKLDIKESIDQILAGAYSHRTISTQRSQLIPQIRFSRRRLSARYSVQML